VAQPTLLVSIHDVMPETLQRVEGLAGRLERSGKAPALLLVVPGRDWSTGQLDRLRQLESRGHALAGHGWHHQIERFGGLYHRLHSALLSRRAAEHLALSPTAIRALIIRCRGWFDQQRLPAPLTYVPPAWAMGSLPRKGLVGLGFRYYETLSGIYDTHTDRMHRIPVIGFEADTRPRAIALRCSNACSAAAARSSGQLRLAIHPRDETLLLSSDLDRWLLSDSPVADAAGPVGVAGSGVDTVRG
jgi:predicted deacetylase